MTQVTHTLTIQSPTDVVFAELIDFEHCQRWQTQDVIKEWHTPAGPIHVGTQCHQIRMFMGKQSESVNNVIVYEHNRHMITESSPGAVPYVRVEYLVEPVEQATKLTFNITLKGNFLFTLMTPLVRKNLLKDVRQRFQNLQRLLEQQQTIA